MNIDGEFRFLRKNGNSSNNGETIKNSVNRGNNKLSKTVDFVKKSTLKCLIPVLMLTCGGLEFDKNIGEYSTKQNIEVPDALRVAPRIPKQKISEPKIIISGEFLGERLGSAPGEMSIYNSGNEFNYLNMYRKLSYNDYKQLFNGFVDVKQGYFGDCYLISTIKSLARSRYFDTLMMTSIQKNSDDSFNLYLPLGSPTGKRIHISKDELNLAKIKGSDGYKILEIGFAKETLFKKNGSMLYAGDMPDIKLTKESMNDIIGGKSFDALSTLLGHWNIKRQLISNTPFRKSLILEEIEKFNPYNLNLILISSRRRLPSIQSDEKTYVIEGQTMYYHHAYSVYSIEREGNRIKAVVLEDPANNKKKIRLSLIGFMRAFSSMTTCSPKDGFLSIV